MQRVRSIHELRDATDPCTERDISVTIAISTTAVAAAAATPFTIASTAIAVPASSAAFPTGRLFLSARPLCVVCGVCILLDRSRR